MWKQATLLRNKREFTFSLAIPGGTVLTRDSRFGPNCVLLVGEPHDDDERYASILASYSNQRIEIPFLCTVCGQPALGARHCGACKKGCYCSRECQVSDWPRHKRRFHHIHNDDDAPADE
jgi:hypothetical protein